MKYLVVVSLCLAGVSCAINIANMKVAKDCLKSYNPTKGDIESFDAKEPSHTAKCMAGCFYLKAGLNKSPDAILRMFAEKFAGNEKEQLIECFKEIKTSDECEMGQKLFECDSLNS